MQQIRLIANHWKQMKKAKKCCRECAKKSQKGHADGALKFNDSFQKRDEGLDPIPDDVEDEQLDEARDVLEFASPLLIPFTPQQVRLLLDREVPIQVRFQRGIPPPPGRPASLADLDDRVEAQDESTKPVDDIGGLLRKISEKYPDEVWNPTFDISLFGHTAYLVLLQLESVVKLMKNQFEHGSLEEYVDEEARMALEGLNMLKIAVERLLLFGDLS